MISLYTNLFHYPKAITLFIVSFVVITWVIYFYFKLKINQVNLSKSHYKYYLTYSIGLFLWILSNCYFQSGYLTYFSEQVAIIIAIFANITAFIAFASAFLFSCQIRQHYLQEKTPIWKYIFLTILSIFALGINLVPHQTIQAIDIRDASDFTIHFGSYTSLFFLTLMTVVGLTFINLIYLSKNNINRLSKARVNYMVSGMVIFMVSTAIIQLGMTSLFGDFSLTWLPPALSISEMLMMGYALITSRFYTIRYIYYLTLTALITTALYLLPLWALLKTDHLQFYIMGIYSFVLGLTWHWLFKHIKPYVSLIVYHSRQSPTEQIHALLKEFQNSPADALEKLATLLNVPSSKMQLVKKTPDDDVYDLYFSKNKDALILEELLDKMNTTIGKNTANQLYEKMNQTNTAIIMPMFSSHDIISHLLISTHKSDGTLFSNEELTALKKVLTEAQSYINSDLRVKQSQALANSIAHEMRNPLTQLQLSLERLQIQLQTGADTKKLLTEVGRGKAAILHGKQLIDIILREVTHASFDQEPMSVCSIKRLILQAINQFGFENETIKQRIHLKTEVDFAVRANDILFNFVIFNLLRNAIYYFDSYPESQIEIKTVKNAHENVVIFSDTGPGISDAIRKHIFDDFYSYNKSGGSGLGLSYCMRVINSFGGTIQCHSEYGQYTEFHLIFPALTMLDSQNDFPQADEVIDVRQDIESLPADAADTVLPPVAPVTDTLKTILVVDDKEVQRTLVKLYLQQLGHQVVQANNGKMAVEVFQNHAIDLVIMDIQMPVMNGFEATTKIKHLCPTMNVIALSGESGEQELELINELMDGRLTKPINKEELKHTLNLHLYQANLSVESPPVPIY